MESTNDKVNKNQLFYLCILFSSCAGICIYESKGNFCRIALSEPLLKLRTRKDLVQTLLVCLNLF